MTPEQAKEYVAHKLAWSTYQAVDILNKVPNLAENTAEITKKNLAAAIALGMEGSYRANCSLLGVPALYEYKGK